MKLLVFSHACVTAINQQFFAELEKQKGWDASIVVPASWRNSYGGFIKPERWSEFYGDLIELPVFKSGNIPLHCYRANLIALIRRIKPDLIYIQHEPYSIVAFQVVMSNYLSLRKPVGFFTWQNIHKQYPIPFRQMEDWVLKQSQVMFAGTQDAANVFIAKGFSNRVAILPGGVDETRYHPCDEAIALSNSLRQSPDEVLVGYVGRIIEAKGLKTLLLGLKRIEALPWRLVMIGAGDYEAEFHALAANLELTDRISFLGYVPHSEAPQYLSALDILVLPSETRANWKEQFGRVIIESMACETPVLGSDSGEIPRLIHTTGGGVVFAEGNDESLSICLEKLILEPDQRKKLGQKGRKSVYEAFTNRALVQSFAKDFELVIV